MSGSGAASNIEGFLYAALNSIYQTTVNFVGQNMGAHQYDRIKKIFHQCLVFSVCVGIVCGTAIFIFGEGLLSIYITDSAEAIQYGMLRLTYVGLPYFLLGLMEVATGALRGLGASFSSMVISILGVCGVRILWVCTIFQIPQFHTLECLFLSYMISWIATFAGQAIAYRKAYNDRIKTA